MGKSEHEKPDVELLTIEELVEAIKTRAPHVAIMFARPGKTNDDNWDIEYAFRGPATAVLGLMIAVMERIKRVALGIED